MTTPDVLVVDDDSSTRATTSQWLEDGGFRVETVSSDREALEVAEGDAPAVVVATVRLPDHDGLWLAQQVRALLPDTALVFVSSSPAAGPRLVRAGIGRFDYLEMPFTASQLAEAVDRGANWHEQRLVERRQKLAAAVVQPKPLWSYDAETQTLTQYADWLPDPAALSRLAADLFPAGSAATAG